MRLGSRARKLCGLIASCLLLALPLAHAQRESVTNSAESVRASLAERARALEVRGRPDMAIQLWHEILLSAPNDVDALSGLAKDYKLIGSTDLANQALDRLRRIDPHDPNIARIESTGSTSVESEALRQAGELARQGRNEEAMRIYRQLYGDSPPNGPIALAYYQALYGTTTGKTAAITGMRALVDRFPSDPHYAIALGTLLTYDAHNRAEGIRILQAHPSDPAAQSALRQALLWNSANPESAGGLREYLKSHPQDTEVAGHLKENEAKLAEMNAGIARNPAERAAFAALNAHQIDEADKRFSDLLQSEPNNGRVEAGIGFVRMQQRNFADAINYLNLAKQHGFNDKSVDDALATSRFYLVLSEGTEAFNANHLDVAQTRFRAALDMNPRSVDALNGLAGVYVRQKQYIVAAGIYDQLIQIQPSSPEAWRGLFLSYARSDQNEKAVAVIARIPAQVTAVLNKDPDYLRTLAAIYQSQHRDADAQRILTLALALPFPGDGSTLLAGTKMQYAGILMEAKRYSQAAALYQQLVSGDPANVSAWKGLISAHHELGQDALALADIQKIPPASYESTLNDADFLALLAAIYQQGNQYDVAQGMLERAEKLIISSGTQPSVAFQLQLAGIHLLRNSPDQAYTIYRLLTTTHPDNADAWKGAIAALAAASRKDQALQMIDQIPAAVRRQLDSDIGFIQTVAGIYSATGDTVRAAQYIGRAQAWYARSRLVPPPAIDIQNAWSLYNLCNDRALYAALMRIGTRTDLAMAQRQEVQEIWANWAVRRAATAIDNGNTQHAIDILDASSLAFPNMNVRKAVAGGYARVGRTKEALALYKTIPMQDASPGDFEGAVGTALAANDKSQAEVWIHQALDRFPRDPIVLSLAARYEQARGDNERAAEYYRESLAVMPPVTPADRLAHALVYPDQDARPHRAVTAADLERLLDPDNEPVAKATKTPSPPPYGPDPYNGPAPVATPEEHLPAPPSSTQTNPAVNLVPQSFHRVRSPARISPIAFSPRSNPFAARRVFASLNLTRASHNVHAVAQSASTPPDITLNPPRSLASESWKGLVFSLIAANRNAEALMELSRIPPNVRAQLESDIEWVQAVASLYVAVGDTPDATQYLKRIEDFYLLHPMTLPSAVEIQHAWLLYNAKNDTALYPVMKHLDARSDLGRADREQVDTLWANWAIRTAGANLDAGKLQRGVAILQAAVQDYPDNMLVRRALAGAYVRAGRAQDALAVYKAIPMETATPGDFAGAIGAAIAAGDLAQSESWLRIALSRYPGDPQVLALAGRFEQARGNNQRAGEFWRAALAAMPPGSNVQNLAGSFAFSASPYPAPPRGQSKILLDPRLNSGPTPEQIAPLPSYAQQPAASMPYAPQWPLPPGIPQQRTPSSNNPLPLPSVYAPSEQATTSSSPVFVQQSATQPAIIQPAISVAFATSVAPDVYTGLAAADSNPSDNRLEMPQTSAPETSANLTPIPLPNLPITSHSISVAKPLAVQLPIAQIPISGPAPPVQTAYNASQSAPSAQEAATGAYSAPQHPEQTGPLPQSPAVVPTKPNPTSTVRTRAPARRKSSAQPAEQSPAQSAAHPPEQPESTQTLANAPGEIPQTSAVEAPAQSTNEEVAQSSLPWLHGPWSSIMRRTNPPSPRELVEEQLQVIESSYSGWLGGTSTLNFRNGTPGYDQLAAIEAPFESSAPLGVRARIAAVAQPVFLDSGAASGTANLTVLKSTTSGTSLVTIPAPIGTLTSTNTTQPSQQNAFGLGGELQLIFPHASITGGYTPAQFLVANFTGRFQWRPGNGPLVFNFSRDPVTDSQLSYAGLRDPGSSTPTAPGQIWGGVVANQGLVKFDRGNAQSGFYFAAGGQYLTGRNVESNKRIDGSAGAYWGVLTLPEYGELTIGANFSGMHYANNQNAFTFGMGGYFSPQTWFLADVPINWAGHWQTRWHYTINGAVGVQVFQQDATPLWPLAAQKSLQASQGNPMLPSLTSVMASYDVRSEAAYQIGPHWFAGFNVAANNTRNYNFASVGFFIRYTFREQPSTAVGPTGLFPTHGPRPFTVP